ncbi:hypothetical protein ACQKKG_00420 [Brevundimonas sp. NPDC003935]|uniref:hypothetical protein n=1 Tax=unclassified Brevundimonas TaxID=2622653 RepID=UPI00289B1D93|nr:hypothetical protein [Brevundimonas sp.]
MTDKTAPRAVVHTVAALGDLVGLVTRGRKPMPLTLQGFAASAMEVTLDIGKAHWVMSRSCRCRRDYA